MSQQHGQQVFHPSMQRRTFLRAMTAGTIVAALGGAAYALADSDDERRALFDMLGQLKDHLNAGTARPR